MQASKIIPHTVYAIMHNDKLVRFQVKKVITTQTRTEAKSSPHDYVSVVIGNVVESDHASPDLIQLSPEEILGPYQEYVELKARTEAEEQAKKKAEDERKALCEELCDKFYQLSQLTKEPPPLEDYRRHYHQRLFDLHYDGIVIKQEGVEPLLAALRGIGRLKVVA